MRRTFRGVLALPDHDPSENLRTAMALLTAAGERELDDWFAVGRGIESSHHWEQMAWALANIARRLAEIAAQSVAQTPDEVDRQVARSMAAEDWDTDGI